jgi:hypothetical protein
VAAWPCHRPGPLRPSSYYAPFYALRPYHALHILRFPFDQNRLCNTTRCMSVNVLCLFLVLLTHYTLTRSLCAVHLTVIDLPGIVMENGVRWSGCQRFYSCWSARKPRSAHTHIIQHDFLDSLAYKYMYRPVFWGTTYPESRGELSLASSSQRVLVLIENLAKMCHRLV